MIAGKPELHVLDRAGLSAFAPDRTAVLAASSCGVLPGDAGWATWRTWMDSGHVAHSIGCLCCAPDRALETALAGLFVDRVQGRCVPFDTVVLLTAPEAVARVMSACSASALIAGRYALRGMRDALVLRASP